MPRDRLTIAHLMLRDEFIKKLGEDKGRLILHIIEEGPVEPQWGPRIDDVNMPSKLRDALRSRGIVRFREFQWESYLRITRGEDTIIMAGTGSGKTEAFLIPILTKILEGARAIIMYPTKALARDQAMRLKAYVEALGISMGSYDGDTPRDARSRLYENAPQLLITNPDMVNSALIHVPRFRELLRNYNILVLDDFHVYNGVLGAHVHYIISRMRRFMRDPQYVATTATVGNPLEFAESLFGRRGSLVRGPMGRGGTVRHILLKPIGRSKFTEAVNIVKLCIHEGRKSIVFADSHRLVELMKRALDNAGFSNEVRVHRAGLSIEERHEVEDGFRSGRYMVILATPTLEMGIDVGDADIAIMATIPPSYSKYLQRSGRVGRRGQLAHVIQILGDDPMSSYYSRNPREFYSRTAEPLYVEPMNDEIAKYHCLAMVIEAPSSVGSLPEFCESLLAELRDRGFVRIRNSWYRPTEASLHLVRSFRGIRGIGDVVRIIEGKRVIGYRELPAAIRELHEGAIYMHGGRAYVVSSLDMDSRIARVRKIEDTDKYTAALYNVKPKIIEIIEEGRIRSVHYQYAKLSIREEVHGYIVRKLGERGILERRVLEPISYEFVTKGLLIYAPILRFSHDDAADILMRGSAYHAAEHVIIMVSESLVGAGPTDMGGISYPTGHIMIYDSYPGGSGATKLLLRLIDRVLEVSLDILKNCPCKDGCPRCVYSPYCGNDNNYLSRSGGAKVIEAIMSGVESRITPLPT